jgi:hypothetical protein
LRPRDAGGQASLHSVHSRERGVFRAVQRSHLLSLTDNRLSNAKLAALAASLAGGALASSHREAPFITTRPKVDGTDFYMFNSYEAGRAGYVTLIANYLPLQDPQGGPNYFFLDDNALYEISIDNTGYRRRRSDLSVSLHDHDPGVCGHRGHEIHTGSADQHRPGQRIQQRHHRMCRRATR